MKLSPEEQEIFNEISAERLQRAVLWLRESQDFGFAALKRLHDAPFQPTAQLPPAVARLMQAYRPLRPALENWQKTRQLSRLPPYSTRYSPLQPADFERVAAAIDAALPENSGQLALAERLALLVAVYAEIDYLHAFGDGNSRVNRPFVQELARANGVILDFRGLDRETVYVARDKSLLALNLARRPGLAAIVSPNHNPNGHDARTLAEQTLAALERVYPAVSLARLFSAAARLRSEDAATAPIQLAQTLYRRCLNLMKLDDAKKQSRRRHFDASIVSTTPAGLIAVLTQLRATLRRKKKHPLGC